VSILLDNGANINGRSGYWTTPLHLSVSEGDLDIFRLLLERGADPNVFRVGDDRESSALCAAGRCKRGTMLKELLEHGADASACESAAVVSAARSGYTQGVEMLVKHGANIHKQQGIPGMALHKAAKNRDVAMVKYLLKQGVDVNARSETSGYVSSSIRNINENCKLTFDPSQNCTDGRTESPSVWRRQPRGASNSSLARCWCGRQLPTQ